MDGDPEAGEEIPDGIPKPTPLRKVQITVFVDADHTHCEVTLRSVTGILVNINSTPVNGRNRSEYNIYYYYITSKYLIQETTGFH